MYIASSEFPIQSLEGNICVCIHIYIYMYSDQLFTFETRVLFRACCLFFKFLVCKNGFAIKTPDGFDGIPLGGRGAQPASEGLLCVLLAAQPWTSHHTSVLDTCVVQGISRSSMQLYADAVRRRMADLNWEEQKQIKFTSGMLVEWDECGVRAERVRCSSPCRQCEGYCPLV